MKKVLIITYYWPPAGGPGVQRILKFAKYLPEYGWEPIILTIKNGEYPALDETLINEVSPKIKVFRSEAKGPFSLYRRFSGDANHQPVPVGILSQKDLPLKKRIAKWVRLNFVIPDAKVGWRKPAIKLGKEIIEQENPDIIFSSSPPPTVHTIAKYLSKTAHIPWVADLRDPWSKIHYYKNNRSRITNKLDARMERKTLGKANRITTVSEHFGKLIDVDKNKLHIISNGYDPKDIKSIRRSASGRESFLMAYVGGLNENRFYPEFFSGLKAFVEEQKLTPKDITLTIAGKMPEKYSQQIHEILEGHVNLDIKGYISHAEAISLMETASTLLLFMEKVDNYEGHIPGKLFEYMASGNYIVGAGPKNGEVQRILQENDSGQICQSETEIKQLLEKTYKLWREQKLNSAHPETLKKYTRKYLTGLLADIFEGVE